MTTKAINIIFFAFMAVAALAMLIAGSVADLDAAHALYVGQNTYINVLGEVLGEVPAYLMLSVAFTLLFIGIKRRGLKKLNILYATVYMLGAIAAFLMVFKPAAEYLMGENILAYVLAGLIGVLMTGLMLFMFKGIQDTRLAELKKWCFTTIIGILSVIVVVYLIKLLWGRTRYYILADVEDYAGFTNWWQPQGMTGDKSFPSGHAALACCSFFLIPLSNIISDKDSRWPLYTAIAATLFTLFTVFCRLMGGNHYLSDVSFAMLVALIAYGITTVVAYGKNTDNYTLKEGCFLNKL